MTTVRAMILAAGAGTRAKYLTDPTRNRYALAKPRFPIIDRPVMDHWVMGLKNMGINRVFANIWSNPHTIESYYSSYGLRENTTIKLYREENLLGTMGSAVKWAQVEGIEGSDALFVLSGDIICNADLRKLLEEHTRVGADLTVAFNPVPWGQVNKYGTAAFEDMPTKRTKGTGESDQDYRKYLDGYEEEINEFAGHMTYRAVKVTDFREKKGIENCCSNLNNSSIYILSGAFVKALAQHGITLPNDKLPKPFFDFGKHGFPFALRNDFRLYGVILPESVYWMDIGDLGKYWLALMDVLDGRFDRSMFGLLPGRDERMEFIDETAYVHPSAELIPPYYIGPQAQVEAYAKVGPYALVSAYGMVQSNSRIIGSAMIETAYFNEGDHDRIIRGSGSAGAIVERSLLASGSIYQDQAAQNNIVLTRPDGHIRFCPIGMDRGLSLKRIQGIRLSAVEE